jgi:hypothetical protein
MSFLTNHQPISRRNTPCRKITQERKGIQQFGFGSGLVAFAE